MNKLTKALLGGTALAGAGLISIPGAEAQTASLPGGVIAVQQSAARADAAAFEQSGTAAGCTTITTTVGGTFTITPPAGNYVYLTNISSQVAGNATATVGGATTLTVSNVTGAPVFALIGEASANGAGPNVTFPTGLKSTTAGSAVTFTQGGNLTSAIACVQAAGYYSPI